MVSIFNVYTVLWLHTSNTMCITQFSNFAKPSMVMLDYTLLLRFVSSFCCDCFILVTDLQQTSKQTPIIDYLVFSLPFLLCSMHSSFVSLSHYICLICANPEQDSVQHIFYNLDCITLFMQPCVHHMQTCHNLCNNSNTPYGVCLTWDCYNYKSLISIFYCTAKPTHFETWYIGLTFNLFVLPRNVLSRLCSCKCMFLMIIYFYFTAKVHYHVTVRTTGQQSLPSFVYTSLFILANFSFAKWC